MPQGNAWDIPAPPETARVARAGFRGAGARVPVSESCTQVPTRVHGSQRDTIAKRHRTTQISTGIATVIFDRRRHLD